MVHCKTPKNVLLPLYTASHKNDTFFITAITFVYFQATVTIFGTYTL